MTPNTQITQANVGPNGWLVKDEDCGWTYVERRILAVAALTLGLPVWSIEKGVYESVEDRPALAAAQPEGK